MKKIFMLLFCAATLITATAQKYVPVDAGSNVQFKIKNVGLTVTGSLTGLKGKIVFDSSNLSAAAFTVSVSAASVNTGNNSRDKHLKKEEYFSVTQYPDISFVSTKIKGSNGNYTAEGQLTIKGVTKDISLPFSATASSTGYRFTGQFKINRRDFNVGGSSWVLSDILTVLLNVSANKQPL